VRPALLLVTALAACSAAQPGPGLDTDRVLDHVALLARAPRVHDTDASRAALAYIEHAVGGGDRVPVGDVPLPAIDVLGSHVRDAVVAHTDDPDLVLRFGPPGPALLITAHYDTVAGSPGADDNASGVAAVLALARTLHDARPARNLRFVFFPNEEAPYCNTPDMGSLRYAKGAAARGDKVVAMLSLESIGYYSDAANSQRYPAGLEGKYPTTGDFIAFVSHKKDERLVGEVMSTFLAHATLPAQGAALPEDVEGVASSDHWSFWQMGWPALMVTDTAPFRNPAYHQPGDLPDKLDYDRMARVVAGLEAVIKDLAGIPGS
jgi:hypothetical protein